MRRSLPPHTTLLYALVAALFFGRVLHRTAPARDQAAPRQPGASASPQGHGLELVEPAAEALRLSGSVSARRAGTPGIPGAPDRTRGARAQAQDSPSAAVAERGSTRHG